MHLRNGAFESGSTFSLCMAITTQKVSNSMKFVHDTVLIMQLFAGMHQNFVLCAKSRDYGVPYSVCSFHIIAQSCKNWDLKYHSSAFHGQHKTAQL